MHPCTVVWQPRGKRILTIRKLMAIIALYFLIFKKIILKVVYVCKPLCGYVYLNAGAYGDQKNFGSPGFRGCLL